MHDLWREFQRAAKGLVATPGFTVIALVTLTLGIGATTAIYTVVHSVLLEPLPYPSPERLVVIQEANPEAGFPRFALSPLNFRDYREMGRSFDAMAARTGTSLALGGSQGQTARRLSGRAVTHDYLKVFGVQPVLGRDFTPQDDQSGAPRVILLGHKVWQSLGGDPGIVGDVLRIDGEPTTVIGVLPESYSERTEALVPLGVDYEDSNRGSHWLIGFGRLAPGVSLEQARTDLQGVAANLAESYPDSNTGWSSIVDPLQDRVVQGVRPALWILLSAVGLVLLIACANVANLTLTRLAGRGHQVAVRCSLGAGRWQLLRPMLAESVLIAAVAGTLGCLLAVKGTRWLVAMNAESIPRSENIAVDGGVLWFALAICLAATFLFGFLPAVRASRPDLAGALKDGGRDRVAAVEGRKLRAGLVLGEVALAMVLLVGAGLLVKSFATLVGVEPGFNPDAVWTARLDLPETAYDDEDSRITLYRRLLDEAAALPAVEHAGMVFPMPLTGSDWVNTTYLEGEPIPPPNQEHTVNARFASSDYFAALGIPIERGRGLAPSDDAESTPVVVVNNSAVRQFWPDDDPVGTRISFGRPDDDDTRWYTVVGVVGDVHHRALDSAVEPAFYRSILQDAPSSAVVVLRMRNDPHTAAGPLRGLVQGLDPDLPLAGEQTGRDLVNSSVAQPRFNMAILALFAGLALVLAAIGVFGVVSYSVSHRLRELGVRMALGARGREIVALVVGQGMRPVIGGLALGLGGAFAASRVLQSLIYGVSTTDPMIFALVLMILAGVAVLACLAPALRALRVDPAVVLRDD